MRRDQQYPWQDHGSVGRGGFGRGGYGTGGGRPGPAKETPAFFGLMRAWAAGVVALLACQYVLSSAVSQPLASMDRMESFGWRLALFHLPTLVCALLATLAAARVHPEPHRYRAGQHLLACLAVPLASRGVVMSMNWPLLTVEGIVAPTLAVIGGCVIGVMVDMAFDARE